MFYKKDILKIFVIFTGKYLCQNLSFNKVKGLRFWFKVLFQLTVEGSKKVLQGTWINTLA